MCKQYYLAWHLNQWRYQFKNITEVILASEQIKSNNLSHSLFAPTLSFPLHTTFHYDFKSKFKCKSKHKSWSTMIILTLTLIVTITITITLQPNICSDQPLNLTVRTVRPLQFVLFVPSRTYCSYHLITGSLRVSCSQTLILTDRCHRSS